MWPFGIVKIQIATERRACFRHAGVGAQIDFLVLDGSPDTFDEDVVPPSALAIHADFDVILNEHLRESRTGELRALILIEDFWLAEAGNGLLDSFNTESRVEADRELPR